RAEHDRSRRADARGRRHGKDDRSPQDGGRAADSATSAAAAASDSSASAHDPADNRHHSAYDDTTSASASTVISIVIPLHDEERSIALLYEELQAALEPLGQRWEAVFVDDGSMDGSFAALTRLHGTNENVRVVRLPRNFGTAA